MRISEVAKLTGLNVSNIRFYEKKGLLAPGRDEESRYRDYTEKDVEQLKKIILFRKMDIPIETIYLMESGEASLTSVLKRQEAELLTKREMLQGSIDLCQRMMEEQNPETIDIDYYLNYVKEEEQQGRLFGEVEELLEDWADFSGLMPFRGDPYVGKFLRNTWVMRALTLICIIGWIGIPLWEISRVSQVRSVPAVSFLLWWLLWLAASILAFRQFRKGRK